MTERRERGGERGGGGAGEEKGTSFTILVQSQRVQELGEVEKHHKIWIKPLIFRESPPNTGESQGGKKQKKTPAPDF